jgi:heme A synthase
VEGPEASPPGAASQVRGWWLPRLAVSTAITAYGLIIFGSHVRVTDSGMGCPDWPLCDGSLGPIHQFHAIMEQTHRYIAAVVTVLVFTTALLALRSRKGSATVRAAVFTAGVVVVQIGLGALTVVAGNDAPTVAAHLLTGLALLGGATVTAVCTLVDRRPATGRRLGRTGWLAVSSSCVLFLSGSLVVNADAQKACAGFPLCPGGQPAGLVALHLVHRSIAVLAGAALLSLALHAWRQWSAVPRARAMAVTLAALVVATAALGITTAMLKAPAGLQDLHLAGAAAVLVVTVSLAAAGWLTAADASTSVWVPDRHPTSDDPATHLTGTH